MEIKSSKDLRDNPEVNTLNIADSGKGKTKFLTSMAKYVKPFFIDAEGGIKTGADLDFDYVQVNTWAEFQEACAWYLENYEEKGYTNLGIDSITRLQQYKMLEIHPDGKLKIQDWGEILAVLRKTVDTLTKAWPTPVNITAMAKESKDELSGQIKIYPNIQGSFCHDLAGYFDMVFYNDCGEEDGVQKYWVQTQGDRRITARNRLQSIHPLNKYEENDYGIVHKILKGNK